MVAEITTRPKPAPAVIAWARSVPSPALWLSVITVAEIGAGIEGTPDPVRRIAFERALTDIRQQYRDRIAAAGEREALAYLALHRRLKSAGTSLDPPDALIAATALANGWTLVRNAEGPGRFPGRGLQVPGEALAEDTRFELVRGCPQHAFQVCWRWSGLHPRSFTCVRCRPSMASGPVPGRLRTAADASE
ncbi:PIN domain-containing protein [Streptomyces sp. NBC_01294]|uniref:PIN domain-containing protein n=1 Tax=Streptomyces sp. NBC_01294 TaxID=2903815 RepID=UPI002DD8D3D5|nr:PIN domain-containing protein [Streptomyces sp. NBC_01294]WRZ61893.1 PIN domain-containing protein [Streptomyces sp. NBC_01294]